MKSSVFQVLSDISKSKGKRVKLCLMESETGSRYLDIRVFAFFGDKWLPTKSGVTFNKDSFPLFMAELEKHQEIIELFLNAEDPASEGKTKVATATNGPSDQQQNNRRLTHHASPTQGQLELNFSSAQESGGNREA